MDQLIVANAQIVTADAVIHGALVVRDGVVADIAEGAAPIPGALDFAGDYLLPGLVELHTDNLERHLSPRPGVRWPVAGALRVHDAMVISAGITTVFDALSIGDIVPDSPRIRDLDAMIVALRAAAEDGSLRAEHRLHLRCELTYENVVARFDALAHDPLVGLVSLMDHSPGQRQFANLDKYRQYYQGKYNMDDAAMDAFMTRQIAARDRFSALHRGQLVRLCRAQAIAVASHDDETEAHIAQAVEEGIRIAEFPTTLAAARAARSAGMGILMGGPNVVLNGSQSGNISARALAGEGLLDIISSDYVPASMLEAAFALPAANIGIALPQAVAMVSANPARLVGLQDRGEIAVGKRGDLLRVAAGGPHPLVRAVWRDGERAF
jgi:alpha-D-ribose 1-methylphosphonate 5-triphosphate diphosphatase